MKRAVAIVAVLFGSLAMLPFAVQDSRAAITEDNAIIDGAALAASAVAVGSFDPDFDFWPVYSSSTTDNSLSHGLSAGFWPGFLLDAFAAFYGFAGYERPGMGISESQYPNPPHDSSASSSAFLRSNFVMGCEFVFGAGATQDTCKEYAAAIVNPPGSIAESESHSQHLTSTGLARGTRLSVPGVFDVAEAVSRTGARFDRTLGRTVVESSFTAREVVIAGTIHIDKIVATSTAISGGSGDTSSATSKLQIVGARSGTSTVEIDDEGAHFEGDRGSNQLNSILAALGLEVRFSQGRQEVLDDGQRAFASTGGLKIRMFRERAEEAFPALVRQNRQALCDLAQRSLPQQEITRIEQRFANPLFGAPIPFVPKEAVPPDVAVSQSVPPPASCPFVNRDTEISFVLGRTDAAARLTPLPEIGVFEGPSDGGFTVAPGADVPVLEPTGAGAGTPTSVLGSGLEAPRSRRTGTAPVAFEARPAVAVQSERDVAARVKVVYGGMGVVALLGMGGPFVLRRLSSL